MLTALRNEILICRPKEIQAAQTEIVNGLQMSSQWLELLRVELCDPDSCNKSSTLRRFLCYERKATVDEQRTQN